MTVQDFNIITSHNKLTLVVFYATWCGPCRATHHILDTLEERMRGTIDVLRIDIDHPSNVELVEHFRVMAVPTLLLFRSGRKLWRESGVLTVDSLTDIIHRYEMEEIY